MLSPDDALASQVSFTDPDIVPEYIPYPSPNGHGEVRGYLVKLAGLQGRAEGDRQDLHRACLRGRQPRVPQRHHAALRRCGDAPRLGPHHRLLHPKPELSARTEHPVGVRQITGTDDRACQPAGPARRRPIVTMAPPPCITQTSHTPNTARPKRKRRPLGRLHSGRSKTAAGAGPPPQRSKPISSVKSITASSQMFMSREKSSALMSWPRGIGMTK